MYKPSRRYPFDIRHSIFDIPPVSFATHKFPFLFFVLALQLTNALSLVNHTDSAQHGLPRPGRFRPAGLGEFLGITTKFAIGILIWLIVAVAAFWP